MTTTLNRERERIEERLDRYRRGLSASPTLYSLGFVTRASEGERPLSFIASTDEPDRAGDVIVQSGWELRNFRANPVYQWVHDYSRPPIGTVPRLWVEGRTLRNTVRFDQSDPFARSIEGKFRRGVLKAQSVGFRPLEFDTLSGGGYRFTSTELLEISAVPIPMNQSALVTSGIASRSSLLWSDEDPFERLARKVRAYFGR